MYVPVTRGSKRSWQYDSAVSAIASSSSVNILLEPSGSFQSKVVYVDAHRAVATDRPAVFNRAAARVQTDLNMIYVCIKSAKGANQRIQERCTVEPKAKHA
jgi:hypothetical protein